MKVKKKSYSYPHAQLLSLHKHLKRLRKPTNDRPRTTSDGPDYIDVGHVSYNDHADSSTNIIPEIYVWKQQFCEFHYYV